MKFYTIHSTGADRLKRKSLAGTTLAFIRVNPALFRKLLMRTTLIILFLITGLIQVSASSSYGQAISLDVKKVSVKTVITQIRNQSGYGFLYTDDLLENTNKVTIKLKNATIEEILQELFKNQPIGYQIDKQTVILSKKEPSILDKLKSALNLDQIDIVGKVVDENGQAVSGATVTVKGTNITTFSDGRGNFILKQVQRNAVIVISFIGFDKKEITAISDLGTVKLQPSSSKLDEVQIIAYGQTSERLNTGDVTSVKAKEIEEEPISNPLAALEGRVPGLFISQSSGVANSGFNIQLRGQNSISNGNDPFYVIDGIPYTSQLLTFGAPILGNGNLVSTSGNATATGNPLSFINPADIESIEILKDADATSIYGTRGANGVILITTKKGKAGKTKVDLTINQGIGHITRSVPFLNTQQYLEMRNEAFKNDGTSPIPGQDVDVLGGDGWDTTRYTNWEKLLIGNTSHYTDAQASVSGGNENTQFLISGGYHRETTVFPGDFPDQKGSVHFSLNNKSDDGKFKMQFSGSYMSDLNNTISSADPTSMLYFLPPDAPSAFNPNGTLNFANETWPDGNPYTSFLQKYTDQTNNLISNLVLSYQVLKSLELKVTMGYTNLETNENTQYPIAANDPAYDVTTGSSTFVTSSISSWIIEPQLNYHINIGKGTLNTLLGTTLQQNTTHSQILDGEGFTSDALLSNIGNASSITDETYGALDNIYKYTAGFVRLNYNLNDEYLVNLTGRRDGSSRFGPGKQFGNFGAAGVAWIFSKEKSVQDFLPFLSFGKLRGSYGTSGNDQIGDYKFLELYKSTQYPYQGIQGLYPTNPTNPDLAWEVTKKLEFGLDLGFFKDRLLLNADYYYNRSSNELVSSPLSAVTGFTSIEANLPAVVQNSGLELSLSSTNIKTSNFRWSTSVNLSVPSSKLISFPGLATSAYSQDFIIGQPTSIIRTFDFAGVNPTTGVYQFRDSHGNLTSNPQAPTDLTSFVNINPKYYGGISNSFTYKTFSLDVLFQYVNKVGPNYDYTFSPGQFGATQPTTVLARWQNPGDVTNIQKFSAAFGDVFTAWNDAKNESNQAYSSASFLRLKNVSLSYSFSDALKHSLNIHQNVRVYLQGQNLLTFTKYKGFDPENASAYGALPPLRIITAGLQVTL